MLTKLLSLSIILLCSHTLLQAKDNVVIYHAYGNEHQVIVQGRMERKRMDG